MGKCFLIKKNYIYSSLEKVFNLKHDARIKQPIVMQQYRIAIDARLRSRHSAAFAETADLGWSRGTNKSKTQLFMYVSSSSCIFLSVECKCIRWGFKILFERYVFRILVNKFEDAELKKAEKAFILRRKFCTLKKVLKYCTC